MNVITMSNINIENNRGDIISEQQCPLLNKLLDSATAKPVLNIVSGRDSSHNHCQTQPRFETLKASNNYGLRDQFNHIAKLSPSRIKVKSYQIKVIMYMKKAKAIINNINR